MGGLSIVGGNRIAIVRSHDSICLTWYTLLNRSDPGSTALDKPDKQAGDINAGVVVLRASKENARRGGRRGRHPCSSAHRPFRTPLLNGIFITVSTIALHQAN